MSLSFQKSGDPDPPKENSEATKLKSESKTPKEELQNLWRELVQKQRVHEMIKCLQAEKKKLKVLHSNIEGNDEFLEFELNHHVRNAAEMITNKSALTDQEFEDIVELCEDKIEQKALREAYDEKKARELYLHNADERRTMLYNFINSQFFTNFMLLTIITSIVGMFLLTFESIAIRYAWPLIMLDSCIIGIFLVEAILKVIIYKLDYFKKLWNLLDMLIIIVNIVEVAVDLITRTLALSTDINSHIAFKFLKSLRALRLLRVIKFLPNLQVIVATVFQSMLSIGSIAVLMLLFIFVFAVMGRGLFYERIPNKFGNLWLSFVTLFQLLTLDDWFELLESEDTTGDVEEYESFVKEIDYIGYWLMFGYLFAYLVIEFFVFLNLFVAVLVDNFQLTLADQEIQKQKEAQDELETLKKFEDLKQEGEDSSLTEEELRRQAAEQEQLGLYADDYFPVEKDSKYYRFNLKQKMEAELLAEFFKDLNSLDFEKFLWKRRLTLFNTITDTALNSRQNVNLPQENENSSEEDNANNEGGDMTADSKTNDSGAGIKKKMSAIRRDYLPSRYSLMEVDEK